MIGDAVCLIRVLERTVRFGAIVNAVLEKLNNCLPNNCFDSIWVHLR